MFRTRKEKKLYLRLKADAKRYQKKFTRYPDGFIREVVL